MTSEGLITLLESPSIHKHEQFKSISSTFKEFKDLKSAKLKSISDIGFPLSDNFSRESFEESKRNFGRWVSRLFERSTSTSCAPKWKSSDETGERSAQTNIKNDEET